jgi:hypothetical protein
VGSTDGENVKIGIFVYIFMYLCYKSSKNLFRIKYVENLAYLNIHIMTANYVC